MGGVDREIYGCGEWAMNINYLYENHAFRLRCHTGYLLYLLLCLMINISNNAVMNL
jgi:hypothetical protein